MLEAQPTRSAQGQRRMQAIFMVTELPTAKLGKQTQYFDVEPDERDKEPKRAVPLHVLGLAAGYAIFDELEIHDQSEGGEADNEDTEADSKEASGLRTKDTEGKASTDSEHVEDEHDKREDPHTGSEGRDDLDRGRTEADDAERIRDKQATKYRERENESLCGDEERRRSLAGLFEKVSDVEGKCANRNSLADRINGREERGRLACETKDNCDDKGGDETAEAKAEPKGRGRLDERPAQPSENHGNGEQNGGFDYRAVNGHGV